jgi:hypothetical protein
MSGRQRPERAGEVPNRLIVRRNADPLAELSQHIDAGPPIGRIHHQLHRSVRLEHVAQSPEARIRVREMMQNPGADNLIEARLQVTDPLDGKLMDLEIVQIVFSLEFLGTAHARRAEVDAGNLSCWPTQGVLCRLRCPTACNEDEAIFPIRPGRPKQMIIRVAPVSVLPEPPIFFEAVDRPRIRITVVEVPDFHAK